MPDTTDDLGSLGDPLETHVNDRRVEVKCEVVAIGTELLLGQIVDTNSSYIGEQRHGGHRFPSSDQGRRQPRSHGRSAGAGTGSQRRRDLYGGLGRAGRHHPGGDRRGHEIELARRGDRRTDRTVFGSAAGRCREQPAEADVPEGASINPAMPGTAPGLICPLQGEYDGKVIYAVPGVPWNEQMLAEGSFRIFSDGPASGVIQSTLRTWGQSESGLAERLGESAASTRSVVPRSPSLPRGGRSEGPDHRQGRN